VERIAGFTEVACITLKHRMFQINDWKNRTDHKS